MHNESLDKLKSIPFIAPIAGVVDAYTQGTLSSGFQDEVTVENMKFKIKRVPYRDVDIVYQTINVDNILDSFRQVVNSVCGDIHTKYLIQENGTWNQCMDANLERFQNPVNILFLKHHYIAKCLFLYLTCGR